MDSWKLIPSWRTAWCSASHNLLLLLAKDIVL